MRGRGPSREGSTAAAAVTEELFTARFEGIAREMGELLRRTALSVNVKERLDFSCALLDPQGRLVVNAPHIPVHLGALGLCVREVVRVLPLGPGDVAVTNSPAHGGSHLPDVTVIQPVWQEGGGAGDGAGEGARLLGYVASRAHHAEIGGTRPGSMPPDARRLVEEGVVIPPTLLVEAGRPRWEAMEALLTEAPHPTRALEENLADLRAALAAGQRGARALAALAADHGRQMVLGQMASLATRAAKVCRQAIDLHCGDLHCGDLQLDERGDTGWRAVEHLDDGTPLAVSLTPEAETGKLVISFEGTGPVHPGNLNTTPAVVRSAVLYVLRLLISARLGETMPLDAIPLNEGLLEPVELVVPPGTILSPDFGVDTDIGAGTERFPGEAPAVVGGNTETSQRLVDSLLKALGLAACSQGTMNNLLFGSERFGYYETVGGGAGATARGPGASGLHTHMTNTRITDPEVLERRYPVRLERFALRRGSGGAGRHRGGDGLVRELTFLEPLELSLLTQHRSQGPYGLEGGEPGQPGRQRLVRADGAVEALGSVDGRSVGPGDRLILETPGGGGWGEP